MYGYTSSPLHRGLPTDRFVAEWKLNSERVRERLDFRERSIILRDLERLPRINRSSGVPNLALEDSPLLLEIPSDLDALRARELEQAKDWQTSVRVACLHYFKAGFAVTDFFRVEASGHQAFYVLEKTSGL